MKLFQNIVIPGYIEGLDYNSPHIPICTSVGPLLRKIIQQHVFFKHIPKPDLRPEASDGVTEPLPKRSRTDSKD